MSSIGTDRQGLTGSTGGIVSDQGSMLLSSDSAGSASTMFGPAAQREILAGLANGDFAVPPPDPTIAISASNPLPYWTFTDVNSGGSITASIVSDSTTASGNVLRWTIATSVPTGKSATLTRLISIPGSKDQAFCVVFEGLANLTSFETNTYLDLTWAWYKSDYTATGTGGTSSVNGSGGATTTIYTGSGGVNLMAPADAAFCSLSIGIRTTGTTLGSSVDIYEIVAYLGRQNLYIAETNTPATYGPSRIASNNGGLNLSSADPSVGNISLNTGSTGKVVASNNLQFQGTQLIGGTNLQTIAFGGTNGRLISVGGNDLAGSTGSTTPGILITKSVTGQPTTNINGSTSTDAFADALRNGGMASDNTNGRFYVYNGSAWKYAALTTPSDSRLKEEITNIQDALGKLKQLVPVAFKWKRPEAHQRTDAIEDDGQRLGFIADQVATTDLKHWVEDMGVGDIEHDLVADTNGRVLAVNIPQNEIEALIVQSLIDIDSRLKALENK
jgi:hypothetical protein